MSTENNQNVELVDIDEFLPMPGAEAVITSEDEGKAGLFTPPNKPVNTDFIDDPTPDPDKDDPKAVIEKIVNDDDDDFIESKSTPGRKKIDKSGLVEVFDSLIKEEFLVPFDDGKPLEEYTLKDWKELIEANFEEREKTIREQTPKEFFESLPAELQYAAEYVAKGGSDMKTLFKALSQMEETRSLDPDNTSHQEHIARQYLQATNFGKGDSELIEDQVQEWIQSGVIAKKAKQFKPKLDELEQEVIQYQIKQQEQVREMQIQRKQEFMDNIYNTLKPADLNGVKLDAKRQKFLWDELTGLKYQSVTGRPTNLLGHLLEEYQFSKNPRYDLIAEATWLLADPEDYKEKIRTQASNETTQEAVRKLKTEQNRKIATNTAINDDEETSTKRKINRQSTNIFKR
jgi:hypothetical protein